MNRVPLCSLLLGVLLPLCAPAEEPAKHDYPTSVRVQYVVECMAEHGGPDFAHMYQCSCSIDEIAKLLPYDLFDEADTYTRGAHAMGERGGVLREGRRAREMRKLLKEAKAKSERKCFPH